MAQITSVAIVATGWTRIDSLASHTYIEVSHPDETQRVGLRITGADPTSGTAWNASGSRRVAPGDTWPMRLAASDQVWARTETGAATVDVSEAV